MGLKAMWNSWFYWLRGGLIGLLFSSIILYLTIFAMALCEKGLCSTILSLLVSILAFPIVLISKIMHYPSDGGYPYIIWVSLISVLLTYFVIGAMIDLL